MEHVKSSHEEADTKSILHALDASARRASMISIQSPDTDVFVLSIRRFPKLCNKTEFITGVDSTKRRIALLPVYEALGSENADAFSGFHAFSCADQTDRFAGKGKLTCWKTFLNSDGHIVMH